MAWVERHGAVFRVRMRTSEGRTVSIAKCGTWEEAYGVVLAVPGVPVDAAARRARRELARSLAVWQGAVRPRPGSDPSVEGWVVAWRAGLCVRASTAAKYDSHLRVHILPRFGRVRLSQLSRVEIKSWAGVLAESMHGSSVCSILALFCGILAEAVREGLMPFNPALRLRAASDRPQERAVAEPRQLRMLAARMPGGAGLMTVTAAYTGMRWGELAGLHRDSLVLASRRGYQPHGVAPFIRVDPLCGALHEVAGRLELGPPKTGAGARLVHLPPFLAEMLAAHLDQHPYPYVFTGGRGGWWHRSAFRRQVWLPALAGDPGHVDAARGQTLLGSMTFHGLRHSHKTWMAELHTSASLQDYRLGHLPRGVQGRYEHHTPGMILRLTDDLEHLWHASARFPEPATANPPERVPGGAMRQITN